MNHAEQYKQIAVIPADLFVDAYLDSSFLWHSSEEMLPQRTALALEIACNYLAL